MAINYTARVKRFSALMSLHCSWCWNQSHRGNVAMLNSKNRVPEEKVLTATFYGVEHGIGMGTMLGSTPKDVAFQKKVYKAMMAHNRDAHPQHIQNMIRLEWIKK
jgi:hypothetical protein